jgi:hypothetical protein
MAMNAMVTPYQLVYLYSAAGGGTTILLALAERWTVRCPKYYNRFSATSSGKVFSDLRHSEAFVFSRIELVTKNDLALRRGYCWGSSSPPKVLKAKKHLWQDSIKIGTT